MWLGVLGPMLITDAESAIAVPAAKQRAVLAVLLVNANRVVPADELSDMVWDGAPPAAARVTVRGLVRRLRLLLGPAVGSRIATRPHGYAAEFQADELDVLRFAELCRDGETALRADSWSRCSEVLGEALRLWRDMPFCDVPCQRLQREEVPRLEQARLQAAEWQAEAELRLGHHDRLVPQLQNLAAEQPLRERFHAQLMIALARCGRQAEALAAYRQARRALIDELGVEPGPELQDLHQRILEQDSDLIGSAPAPAASNADIVPAAALQPRQLPTAIRHFTGRARELETLSALLEETAPDGPAVVIAAISGMAGVGKTALAVHFAHQAVTSFRDGQLYANLRGIGPGTPATPSEVIRGFLAALGVAPGRVPARLDELTALYRSVTAGRRLLIVLDNALDEKQVRPLLPGSPGSLVIVTSRSQLTGLAAAEGGRLLSLDVLSGVDAHALLAGRLGSDRADADPDAAAEIAALCGRLPLALGVTAARAASTPGFSLASLAAEFRDRSRLAALDVGDPAVSVRTVFSWSYAQLPPATARMFRLLGLHPGPDVSVPAAASLAGVPVSQAWPGLAELARVHLVTEPFPGRYGFHDLLRAYAAEQAHAEESDEARRAATGRILDHYLRTADAASRLLKVGDSVTLPPPAPGVTPEAMADTDQALAWFDAEYHVLLAAVTLAADNGFDACAWQLPRAMARFLDRRGHWHEWAAVQRIAQAAALRLGDSTGQIASVRLLACACIMLGDYADAEALLAECLQLSQSTGDLEGELYVYLCLAWLAGDHLEHYAEALAYCEHALALSRRIGDHASEAIHLNGVGWFHAKLGNYPQALIFCQQALDMHHQGSNRTDEGAAWDSLGYIHHHLGHFAEAADCYSHSVGIFRDIGDRFNAADSLTRLGDAYHAAGDQAAARGTWEQALSLLSDLRHPDAAQVQARLDARS
jgi:DNA-binding SARP family transcriptional activator